jgi:glycosyltransferase involved in cell wall biosynthesis
MRILICATEAPLPPLNGMRLQLRELVRGLAARHEVCVLAFRWPEQTGSAPDGVELIELPPPRAGTLPRLAGWARALARREPVEATKLAGAMTARIEVVRAAREFDVAHVTIGALAGVAPALAGLSAVIVPLDAWHLNVRAQVQRASGARRAALGVQERLVRHFTATGYRPFARAVFVTDADARAARALDPSLRTVVIGNGVDTERFSPDGGAPEPGRILFTGALHAPSNEAAAVLLADAILPAVRERVPAAHLCLAGRAPGPAVRELATRPGIEVAADVPDLTPWLRSAEVFACAMTSGTGIKNKLLEALATATPCVATPLACQGLAVRDGEQLVIAEPDGRFADAVAALLADPERRRALGAAGRAYVEAHHGWRAVVAAYERLYTEVAA